MEYRKVMDIIAYYLSEFDKRAFDEFGFETQTKGFDEIAALFGKKGSYLRRLRDEYDVTTSSFRRGQCNRPPRSRIIQTTDYLRQFSFEELTEIVRAFLENARLDNDNSEEFQQEFISDALDESDLEKNSELQRYKCIDRTTNKRPTGSRLQHWHHQTTKAALWWLLPVVWGEHFS